MQLLTTKEAGYYERRLNKINPWYFLAAAACSAGVSVYALRQNNLTMLRLKEQVAIVDQQNGDIEGALRDLREHVYGHMNTNISSGANPIKPPIQLKYEYERLVASEKERVSTETAKIYTEGQAVCEAQYPNSFSGGPRVPCVESYVGSRKVTEKPIPDSLYKFDFVSPAWTPDVAGISMVLSAILLSLFVLRFGAERWLKSQL
ncbi:MAG: hypothetical protein KIH63_000815 [Candidatus Saccharibacteria bacterium]|nr:hypothetical protein [Candidatus Saccharibacteria bacterium]